MSAVAQKRGSASTSAVATSTPKSAVVRPKSEIHITDAGRRGGRCPKCGDGFAGTSGFCSDCGG